MNTHISYKTAKALKEFLGDKAPKPMYPGIWFLWQGNWMINNTEGGIGTFPSYQLHDLLSKPFCEAMAAEMRSDYYASKEKPYTMDVENLALNIRDVLVMGYYRFGLPAVEAELMKMMEAK